MCYVKAKKANKNREKTLHNECLCEVFEMKILMTMVMALLLLFTSSALRLDFILIGCFV